MLRTAFVTTCLAVCAAGPAVGKEPEGSHEPAPFDEGMREALPDATLERPCGEQTIAHVRLPNGNTMSFCLYGRGWIFNEVSSVDREFYLDRMGIRRPQDVMCAVDLYMAVTKADVPLPVALLEACPIDHRKRNDYHSRRIVRHGVFQKSLGDKPTQHSHFCAPSTGKAAFLAQCPKCDPFADCIVRGCFDPILLGFHQHTMSNSDNLGEEGNIAMERNASCGGSTRVRGWGREDIGDPWGSPKIDFMLSNGSSSWTGFIWHSIGIFGQDYDFRMRGDSDANAGHRHATYFEDE